MTTPSPLLLIGAGHMGGAILHGWIAQGLGPVVVVEPRPSSSLLRLATNNRIRIVDDLGRLRGNRFRACVLALKPQILKIEATRLRGIAKGGVPIISIAAGTRIAALAKTLGRNARIVRAMPNIAGAIGRGISGLYAAKSSRAADRALAELLLSSLGEIVWLAKEDLLDSVTAVSGSGPAYVFLLVEALAQAGEREGLPTATAKKLARATVIGSGALLDFDRSEPEKLRASVTSPGGTTEAALEVLLAKNGLRALIARAVRAARRRGRSLS